MEMEPKGTLPQRKSQAKAREKESTKAHHTSTHTNTHTNTHHGCEPSEEGHHAQEGQRLLGKARWRLQDVEEALFSSQ